MRFLKLAGHGIKTHKHLGSLTPTKKNCTFLRTNTIASKFLELVTENIEALAVIFAETMLFNGAAVFGGAVPFVGMPAIMGEFLMELPHKFVAVSFGQHTRSRNGCVLAIALYDALMGDGAIRFKPVAIDQ